MASSRFIVRALACLVLVTGLSGCKLFAGLSCSADPVMRIKIGASVYSIANPKIVTPEDAPGLVITGGGSRYCQHRLSEFVFARQLFWHAKSDRPERKRMLVGIMAPDSFIDSIKPKWPAIRSDEIAGFEADEIVNKRGVSPNMTARLRLKSGEVRPLTFWCGWTDEALNGYQGGWIGLCRPILPLADGNFLEISTGATPETDAAPIGQDIVTGLREAEGLIRSSRNGPERR